VLYKHQEKIIKEDRKKYGLFLGTGSGKTRIALLLARGKTLVICPKTQREDKNWQREAKNNNLKIDLTVISKEDFRRDSATLPRFDTVIIDEAHTCLGVNPTTCYVKGVPTPKTSKLFSGLQSFLSRTKPERFYLVTATVIRSPMTVWAAAVLLGYDINFYQFRDRFYTKLPMPGREVYRAKSDDGSKDSLANLVKKIGYVGRLEDYFDVPQQQFKTIYVELTDEQRTRLKTLPLDFPEPIVLVGKKHQVENGVLSGDEFNPSESFPTEKLRVILDLALEFPRMVVFAKYRGQIDYMQKLITEHGYNVLTLTGDTKDRGSVLAQANSMKECIFIAQSQISAGWELPQYPLMVFASMSYSVVDRIQGEGRILRANALKKNLFVDIVVRGGVDEAVYKCIKNKQDFDERIYLKI